GSRRRTLGSRAVDPRRAWKRLIRSRAGRLGRIAHMENHERTESPPGRRRFFSGSPQNGCPGSGNEPGMMRIPLAPAAVVALAACAPTRELPRVSSSPGPCRLPSQPLVQLFGAFERPGMLAYEPGLTVYGAIQRGGGLASSAQRDRLRIV